MKNNKNAEKQKTQNNRKLFDVVDKVGDGIRKYGPMTLAFVVTVATAGKIKPKK